MSKFLSRAGSQIDELQRHLADADNSPPSQTDPQTLFAPRIPSRLQSSMAYHPRPPVGPDSQAKPAAHRKKLGTLEGVFVPVILNIWGVILFLRLGYIIGNVGLAVTLLMFLFGYSITTFTTLSLSAISTNGTVRGGGPYYMISRSLGPEFGGSIGTIIYLGTTLNVVLNALAFVEGVKEFFAIETGSLYKLLPSGPLWGFLYSTVVLILSLWVCLFGSKVVARVSLGFGLVLLVSTLSLLCTFIFQTPFEDNSRGINYLAPNLETLKENLWPELLPHESFQALFGVLFPACIGIMAGASMSGDLKSPSKSIPKGTLSAIFATLVAYITLTVLFAASTSRVTLQHDTAVLTHIGLYPPLVNVGVLATSISSTLGCYLAASKILQAMARDDLVPILQTLGYGTSNGDEPLFGLLLTYALAQCFVLIGKINLVAGVVTMFFVLTFGVTNLACFLLKVGAAPNFRPSFRYFKGWTALVGVVFCFGAMFYVDPVKALLSTVFACLMFGLIHFLSPPKSWGDVTQGLIYHQVRKYLLRLDSRKEHVKFWRPQILLLVNDPRTSFQLIQFCNALKKGSLYILGHTLRGDLRDQLVELKRQRVAWLRFVDVTQIKAFIQLSVAADERLGARNLLLGSGLGGMAPNILVLGAFNLPNYRLGCVTRLDGDSDCSDPRLEFAPKPRGRELGYLLGPLPTDEMKSELPIAISDYVGIVEDALLLGKAVAVAYGFGHTPLEPCLPPLLQGFCDVSARYIDLWPIQMTRADCPAATNFDSYTMVLQLGCILHMVPQWRDRFILRVCCFVEHQADVLEERARVRLLLENLRVPAELCVFWLDSGAVEAYDFAFGPRAMPIPVAAPLTGEAVPPLASSLVINVPIPELGADTYPSAYPESPSSSSGSDQLSDLADLAHLPSPAQHRILNNLMRLHSSRTALIFSTLPAPEPGCCDALASARAYLEALEELVDGLPPPSSSTPTTRLYTFMGLGLFHTPRVLGWLSISPA
ncbi:hypothetical protein L0F63_006154, partial [Massospora cicadina]